MGIRTSLIWVSGILIGHGIASLNNGRLIGGVILTIGIGVSYAVNRKPE